MIYIGRYYDGDISGKFWFGVQDSYDADFFGVTGTEPNYVNYDFGEDDLPKVEEGIAKCIEELGEYKTKLDYFFNEGRGKTGYTDKGLEEDLKVKKAEATDLLKWYARLSLGEQIAKCIKDNGSCSFEAEL